MAHRVSAVIIDHTEKSAILRTTPRHVEFTHDGSCWYEALDILITKYVTEYRNGQNIDVDRLEVRSVCMMYVVDNVREG